MQSPGREAPAPPADAGDDAQDARALGFSMAALQECAQRAFVAGLTRVEEEFAAEAARIFGMGQSGRPSKGGSQKRDAERAESLYVAFGEELIYQVVSSYRLLESFSRESIFAPIGRPEERDRLRDAWDRGLHGARATLPEGAAGAAVAPAMPAVAQSAAAPLAPVQAAQAAPTPAGAATAAQALPAIAAPQAPVDPASPVAALLEVDREISQLLEEVRRLLCELRERRGAEMLESLKGEVRSTILDGYKTVSAGALNSEAIGVLLGRCEAQAKELERVRAEVADARL